MREERCKTLSTVRSRGCPRASLLPLRLARRLSGASAPRRAVERPCVSFPLSRALCPTLCCDASGQGSRSDYADLLPENGAHADFESIPNARNSNPGPRPYIFRKERVCGKLLIYLCSIGSMSKIREIRAFAAASFDRSSIATRASRQRFFEKSRTATTPMDPPIRTTRRHSPPTTLSTPGMARCSRNWKIEGKW